MGAVSIPLFAFRTNDVDLCRDYILSNTGTHRFEVSAPENFLSFEHQATSLGNLSINSAALQCLDGFSIRKAGAASYYSFQFIQRGTCHLEGEFGHLEAGPGDVFVLDPEHIVREYWPDDCQQLLVRIDREALEHLLAEELGRRLTTRLRFQPVCSDPGIVGWLRQLEQTLLCGADGGAPMLADRRVSRRMEQFVSMMLLTGLRHTASAELTRSSAGPAPYYVKRAEEFIGDNFTEEIGIDDIAAAAGVSVRSIFYGFKRWRNTTPMSYLRDVRLEAARAQLRRARGARGSVSAAALAAGFGNFSQFSRMYKSRYGEKPSATLMGEADGLENGG